MARKTSVKRVSIAKPDGGDSTAGLRKGVVVISAALAAAATVYFWGEALRTAISDLILGLSG